MDFTKFSPLAQSIFSFCIIPIIGIIFFFVGLLLFLVWPFIPFLVYLETKYGKEKNV